MPSKAPQRSSTGFRFSERYGQLRLLRASVREERAQLSEHSIQCLWYDQLFRSEGLVTIEGQRVRVVSPGWWNRSEGPDFRGAQIEFNGQLQSGDVEIDMEPSGWRAHGHAVDHRYDDVILHIVFDGKPALNVTHTSAGRGVPTLLLRPHLLEDHFDWAQAVDEDGGGQPQTCAMPGRCAGLLATQGIEPLREFLMLAAEWRMLQKARALRERMDRLGPSAAIYEDLLYACGFSHFKHHFRAVARALPYDRARQLARKDPLLLEAAMLQLAGLLPSELPEGNHGIPHFARLRAHRHEELPTLRALPLTWKRVGVRPVNYPERRMAGAALLIARTAPQGLAESLMVAWRSAETPIAQRRALEALFPKALGFWARHCTWTGKDMATAVAPLGPGRVRSIVGNVFIPAALAVARHERDRSFEEVVLRFFRALPPEPDNHIVQRMLPRVAGGKDALKLSFQIQQGLLQMHQDWCEPNPSCRNCSLFERLDRSWLKRDED